MTHALFAACLPGLEPLLAAEVMALGAVPRALAGGVAFDGDTELLLRAHLWLGTASHVLLRCGAFHCRGLGELERKTADLPWPQWIAPAVARDVRARASRSRLYHTGAIAERVQNGITAALGPAGLGDAAVALAVRLHDDHCTISLDTALTPLHRRSYRLQTAKAPLREDLAHALVLASGWRPGTALLDPFCGAGTIAIEAAGLALGLAPGRLRPPPLQHSPLFDAALWERLAKATRPAVATALAASDRDAGAMEATRANAARAGVLAALELRCCALAAHPWLAAPADAPQTGVAVTNPPFGQRVRTSHDLTPLYQTLGARLRALGSGWTLALLASDRRLARRTGLELRTAFTTQHGGLRVSAMVSGLLAAEAP